MKKLFILGIGLLFAGLTTQAQTTGFGIKGGLNVSKFAGDPDPNSEFNTGFHAGIFANIPVTGGWSFEPSLEYSVKGAEFTSAFGETKTKLSYVDLPLMARYQTSSGFSLFAGPQVAFLADTETEFESNSNNPSTTIEGSNDSFEKSVVGAKAGIGFNIRNIAFNAAYATDLQNIYKDNTGIDRKNQVITLGVAFRIR